MKIRTLAFLFFLFAFAGSSYAQGQPVLITTFSPTGSIKAGATVAFCSYPAVGIPCTNTASIYQDIGLTVPIVQPLTSNAYGTVQFWVAPGEYDFTVTGQGVNPPQGPFHMFINTGGGSGPITFTAPSGFVVAGSPGTAITLGMPSGWGAGSLLVGTAPNTVANLPPGMDGYIFTMSGGVPTWLPPLTETRVCQINYGDTSSGVPLTTGNIEPQPLQCALPQDGSYTDVRVAVDSGASTVKLGYLHDNATTAITGVLTPTTVSGFPYPLVCANTAGTNDTIAGVSVPCGTLSNTTLNAGDYIETIGGTADGTSEAMSIAVFFTQPGGNGGGGSGGSGCGLAYDSTVSYGAGCSATYGGNTYVSLTDGNINHTPASQFNGGAYNSLTYWQSTLPFPPPFMSSLANGPSVQFVAPAGNDANDGRTWGTAKATWKAACAALYTGNPGPPFYCGVGTIYVQDGIWAESTHTYGMQLVGNTDPAYPTSAAGWENVQGAIQTICVGGHGSTSEGSSVCTIQGGSAADLVHPGLWVSGFSGPTLEFDGLSLSGQGRNVVLSVCTDGTEGSGCGVGNVVFKGVETVPDTGSSSSGPGWYFGANTLWIKISHFSIAGNTSATVTADNRAAALFGTNSSFAGVGAITFDQGILIGGGLVTYGGTAGGASISLTNYSSEGGLEAQFWSKGTAGPGTNYFIANNQFIADCSSGDCYSIRNDGAAVPEEFGVLGPTSGYVMNLTATALGNPTVTPTTSSTYGFISPSKFRAQSDAAAREFPAVIALSAPLISSSLSGLSVCGTCTLTTGIADPSGGTAAIQISDTSGGSESDFTATGDGGAVNGDTFIYSAWVKPVSGNCCAGGGTLVFRTNAGGDDCAESGSTFAVLLPFSYSNSWQHYIGTCSLTAYASGGAPKLGFTAASGTTMQYFNPQIMLLHGYTADEIKEIVLNLGTWSSACTAGQLCSVRGPIVASSVPCSGLPALTGDTTTSAGSCATTTTQINGGQPPASAVVTGTNSSRQFIAPTAAAVTAFLNPFTSSLQGLVPASGGGTTNFLRADGSFVAPPGAAPGGSSGNIQTNNGSGGLAALSPTDCSAGQATTGINVNGASQGCFTPFTASAFLTLTDAATVSYNAASASNPRATVTLGGNRTLAVTNMVAGGSQLLDIVQDGSGGRTLTLGTGGSGGCTSWAIAGTGTAISLTTTAGAIDELIWVDHAGVCEGALIQNFGGTSPKINTTVGSLNQTSVSTANSGSDQIIYTIPAAGFYHLAAYVDQSAGCATVGSGALVTSIKWTDATAARVDGPYTFTPTTSATVNSSYGGFHEDVWAAAASTLVVNFTYTACMTGTWTYDVHAVVVGQ